MPGKLSLRKVIVDSINRTDLDLRKSLFSNIVLSGGSTLCTGFGDRLLSEVKKLALKDVKLKIYAPPERKVRVFGNTTLSWTDRAVFDVDRGQYLGGPEYLQKGESASVPGRAPC